MHIKLKLLCFALIMAFACNVSAQYSAITGGKDHLSSENITNLIPALFFENQGQWDKEIIFRASSGNSNLYFMKDYLCYGLRKKETSPSNHTNLEEKINQQYEYLSWEVHFKGIDKEVEIIPEIKNISKTNYLKKGKSIKKIANYHNLRYKNIYSGIDLCYYSTGKELKYDYIIRSGAKINDIVMEYKGVKSLQINSEGGLHVNTIWGQFCEAKPVSYQYINGEKKEVEVKYYLINDTTLSFRAENYYNPDYELIIDPVLIDWSTFVGGNDNNYGGYACDFDIDKDGFVYVTGTYRDGFPTTSGSYDQTFGGGGSPEGDAFVFKLDSSGSNLIYATYLGGDTKDVGWGIKVNDQKEAFITGSEQLTPTDL